jgi:hypothetical protein
MTTSFDPFFSPMVLRKIQLGESKLATDRIDDVHAFRVFLDEQRANGGAWLTPAQALELWEIQNASEDGEYDAVEAIWRGFADIEAGMVRPAWEALAKLRRKHNLPEFS